MVGRPLGQPRVARSGEGVQSLGMGGCWPGPGGADLTGSANMAFAPAPKPEPSLPGQTLLSAVEPLPAAWATDPRGVGWAGRWLGGAGWGLSRWSRPGVVERTVAVPGSSVCAASGGSDGCFLPVGPRVMRKPASPVCLHGRVCPWTSEVPFASIWEMGRHQGLQWP